MSEAFSQPQDDSLSSVPASKFAKQIEELTGLTGITYCCLIIDFNNNTVRANVEYIHNERAVNRLLQLLKDGTWKDAEV